jgi:Mlc titration factor MtfA (ptsG expression regulator)
MKKQMAPWNRFLSLQAFLQALRSLHDLRTQRFPWSQRSRRSPTALADPEWGSFLQQCPLLAGLPPAETALLRTMTEAFLHEKSIVGIGLDPTPFQHYWIAAHACLPTLHLGLQAYRHWQTVLLYPDTFVPEQEWMDEAGILHQATIAHAGEAWERGPVILSWGDIAEDPGIILHEMLHTLDAANGSVNGFPILPARVSRTQWTEAFTAAYTHFCTGVEKAEQEDDLPMDPYAATDPGEFLAVMGEYFFLDPAQLHSTYPDLYTLFRDYLALDPLSWVSAGMADTR